MISTKIMSFSLIKNYKLWVLFSIEQNLSVFYFTARRSILVSKIVYFFQILFLLFKKFINKISLCVCVCVRARVCVRVIISFHCRSFSCLNKTINVMLEFRSAMECYGNISVSTTFVSASKTFIARIFSLATVQKSDN